jgi:squalene-hopene/tetraprenyl-beta-curcumene cyclase
MAQQTNRRRFLGRTSGTLGALWLAGRVQPAAAAPPTIDELTSKAIGFLRPRQKGDGSWSAEKGPGVTALVVTALLRSKRVTPDEPAIARGLLFLEGTANPKSGGLGEGPNANYVTAIALMAFKEANTRGQFDLAIDSARKYLKGLQWDEGEKKGPDDPYYGGAGYGSRSRPDLSNTSFFIEALRETGLPPDDPNLRKALVFVSRCQNLKGEFNDQPWAGKVNDGGFIYTPAGGGASMAGPPDSNGGLRSYASMTYAGLKSMIYAGLKADDPRVKAATEYIAKHYSVDENPGMGQAGLYYYYQTFAKTLALVGQPTFTDAAGQAHDWRADLTAALAKRQAADGSWVNPADRFMEGDPNLVTAYALLALSFARPAK